ncbi:ABC transporter ATP-binding protein [Granulosicoccaceae sp. 1_MG-2023]|nr:ABC transporter ATP-binding protein [Granulosicoccaceae sp. 1_MG-2023]
MTALLEVRKLCKTYDTLCAVDGIDLTIDGGRCFGLLGPNGAGKTTTVEMLEGIVTPTSGDILYRGKPLGDEFRRRAGIMFQSTALQDFMKVREALQMFAAFYPTTRDIDSLIRQCALGEYLERDVRRLSGGQRQRLLLAIALVNDPDIVFLDEPTTGLDPQARRNFWDLVKQIKAEGKTVVLTTHYMDEAYQLCDELVFMDHGKIIAQGSPRDLLDSCFGDVILTLPCGLVPASLRDALGTCREHDGLLEIASQDVNATLAQLLGAGISLEKLKIRERNLEDLFLELTGRELRH